MIRFFLKNSTQPLTTSDMVGMLSSLSELVKKLSLMPHYDTECIFLSLENFPENIGFSEVRVFHENGQKICTARLT